VTRLGMKGFSQSLVANIGVELELSAEEEDWCAVVLEAAEAAGGGFAGLDATVESFCRAVTDAVTEPCHDILQTTLDHLCHFHDRR
jgi:hypothetical protein